MQMKRLFFLLIVFGLISLLTVSTDSSDSQSQVSAYAYGSSWTEWYYDTWLLEWDPTYFRQAYGGVLAPSNSWGWWDALAYVDSIGDSKNLYYDFGVDDGINTIVPSSEDHGGSGRAQANIGGNGSNNGEFWSDTDSASWTGNY